MSTAAHSRNYRQRQKQSDVTLLEEIQKLRREVASLRRELAAFLTESDVTHIEQNQAVGLVSPETHAGARVLEISLTSESYLSKKEKKKHTHTSSPPPPGFDVWWERWPNKVCKKAAVEAFRSAAAKTSVADLIAGVDRYIRSKPADRQWCHPATWLNGERWTDMPPPPVEQRQSLGM